MKSNMPFQLIKKSGELCGRTLVDEYRDFFSSSLLGHAAQLAGRGFFDARGVGLPVAVSAFGDEIYKAPKSWAEKAYPKLIHYNEFPNSGHFAAWEQPELLVGELRAGFKSLRS